MRYHPRGKSRRERKPNARPLHYNGRSYPRSSKPCIESHPLLWCMRSRGAGRSVRRLPLSQQVKSYVWWNGCSSAESEDSLCSIRSRASFQSCIEYGAGSSPESPQLCEGHTNGREWGLLPTAREGGFQTRPYDRHGGTVYCHGNDGLPLGTCVDGLAVGD
jgi:hypothetical protein